MGPLLKYTLKRLLYGAITVFFIATATFLVMHIVPGDPISGNKAMLPEIRANLEERYGLNKPVYIQYITYIKNFAQGDFGISFTQHNRSVNAIIRDHFPVSAMVGLLALLFATTGGIIYGSIAALHRGRWEDRWLMFLVVVGVSVPNFVFAALGQYALTFYNAWLRQRGIPLEIPVGGWEGYSVNVLGFPFEVPYLKFIILPAIVLGIATLAFLTRLMRSSMLEIVHQDYVRTAKAKGLSPMRIFIVHQLRNAVLPVITYLGPAIATLTTGGFVVETVFAIPGLGRYFVEAFQQLDYTVIMGITVFYGAFLVFMVVLVDILYGFVDPRISLAKGRG